MGKKKILIIEDEPNLAQSLSIRLEDAGYKTQIANNGVTGWEILQKMKPGLVLLDVMLPGMDGYAVCRLAKNNKKTKDIPIIMLTAKSLMKEVDQGFSSGADAYIMKPYDPKILYNKISELIG
ncbi:response regulator transcription factor [Elusimicrobiota bacterium]